MTSDPSGDIDCPSLDAGRAAAVAAPGPAVVVGGPGSGKTTVLVERAVRLIRSGVPKEQILLLALSRRIGADLTARLVVCLGTDAPSVITFHAMALGLVRRHYREAGYDRPPRRLPAQEAWRRLRQALGAEDPHNWPRYGGALHTHTLLAQVSDLVAGAANNVLNRQEMGAALERQGRTDLMEMVRFAADYRLQMKRDAVVDMEQAVAEAVQLLDEHSELLPAYRQRYPHLLVDEFEEATFAQAWLARLVGGDGLFLAGNPDQSTNAFQGGSPSYLRELANEPAVTVLRLTGNHRCAPGIQEACQRLISGTFADGSTLEPLPSDRVGIHAFPYQTEEVRWLATEIAALLREGVPPQEVAVLFRSGSNPVARELARQLERLRVPFQPLGEPKMVGTDPLVGSAVEVIRYLLATEADRNRLFLGLLASPLGGLAPGEVRSLRRAAQTAGVAPMELSANADALSGMPDPAAGAIAGLTSRLKSLAATPDLPPNELIWQIWALFPAYTQQARAWGEGRLEECAGSPIAYGSFLAEVGRLMEENPPLTCPGLVALWDGGYFREIPTSGEARSRGGVVLTTIHRARGRGWPYLFLPDLVEGVYPLRRSPIGTLSPLLLRGDETESAGVQRGDEADGAGSQQRHLAEERRLLYVALSRAGRQACLSHSSTGLDGTSRLSPSRYLTALGAECPPEVAPSPSGNLEETVAHYRRQLADDDHTTVAEALHALGRLAEAFPNQVDPVLWWDNMDETEGASPPYPDGRLYLSASRLAAYRDCPLRYKFARHLKLDDVTGDAMTLGSLVHGVLEEYHRPGANHPQTREGMERIVEEKFDAAAFSRPAIARQVRRRVTELLNLYFPRYGQTYGVVQVETGFRFQLGPHTVSGWIDRMDRLDDGTLELIDYKTGGAMSVDDARTDIQLALYDLAFQHDSALAELGRPSLATYLYPKAIGKKATTNGKRSYTPSEEGRGKLLGKIDRYSLGILGELFPPHSGILDCWPGLDPEEVARVQRGDPCRYCSFGWVCPEMERGPTNG